MGCCEIICNNSVHWTVQHEALNGAPKVRRPHPATSPDGDSRDLIEIAPTMARGVDSISAADIGTGKRHNGQPKDHRQKFRVALRFKDRDEARRELTRALRELEATGSEKAADKTDTFALFLDVTAQPTSEENANQPAPNRYAQVSIVW